MLENTTESTMTESRSMVSWRGRHRDRGLGWRDFKEA